MSDAITLIDTRSSLQTLMDVGSDLISSQEQIKKNRYEYVGVGQNYDLGESFQDQVWDSVSAFPLSHQFKVSSAKVSFGALLPLAIVKKFKVAYTGTSLEYLQLEKMDVLLSFLLNYSDDLSYASYTTCTDKLASIKEYDIFNLSFLSSIIHLSSRFDNLDSISDLLLAFKQSCYKKNSYFYNKDALSEILDLNANITKIVNYIFVKSENLTKEIELEGSLLGLGEKSGKIIIPFHDDSFWIKYHDYLTYGLAITLLSKVLNRYKANLALPANYKPVAFFCNKVFSTKDNPVSLFDISASPVYNSSPEAIFFHLEAAFNA